MSFETLTLLLPVLWAVVATAVGLILYKSSSALFIGSTTTKGDSRKIRLAGSVTIAALAFYGMKIATPADRLQGEKQGFVSIEISKLNELHDRLAELDRLALEVQGCVATIIDEQCKGKIAALKRQTNVLSQASLVPPLRKQL